MTIDRRAFVVGGFLALASPPAAVLAEEADARRGAARDRLADLETRSGGRLGVAVIGASGCLPLLHRESERFPMCSTFKALAAAALLKRVDQGQERLDRKVSYAESDLLNYAPVAKAHASEGGMTLADLCAAAIDFSDNTAANLVLAAIDGPAGFTSFVRALGDETTRLDRNEPSLNTAIPGDDRDTTSPIAMAQDLQKVLLGDVLSEGSRRQLEAWMTADKVGDKRLRAGLPKDWSIGDKTGSGDHGTANTIAILRPPGRAPLMAAVYYTQGSDSRDVGDAVNRQVGEIIAATF